MDCRGFRNRHVAYVDDTLSSIEMGAVRRHLQSCPRCARHDTAVRRSLLLVRNLRNIEPSSDFMVRLSARLEDLNAVGHAPRGAGAPALGTFAAVAAGIALVAYFALESTGGFAARPDLRLPPVVATVPETPASPMADPAFVASVSTGMALWPAVLMAEQAPLHLANVEFRQASLTR